MVSPHMTDITAAEFVYPIDCWKQSECIAEDFGRPLDFSTTELCDAWSDRDTLDGHERHERSEYLSVDPPVVTAYVLRP